MAFSPNGKQVVSGSFDKSVKLWNVETGTELSTMTVDSGPFGVTAISFSPKGDMIAAGCANGKIYFFDAQSGEVKRALRGHSEDNTECICEFHPLGEIKNHRAECPVSGHSDW